MARSFYSHIRDAWQNPDDGALAALALALLVAALGAEGRLDSLLDPAVAALGVLGSFALEWVLLRRPERTRDLWERRPVRAAAVALTVGGGIGLLSVAGAWPAAAALSWGLLAYLVLLGLVVHGSNPVARLVDTNSTERGRGQS